MDKIILRDDLLIAAATRAAYMDCAGVITLDSTKWGMEKLSEFIRHIVDKWIEHGAEGDFDEYIEENLIFGFSEDEKVKEAHWIISDSGCFGRYYTCSNCKYVFSSLSSDITDMTRCANCGEHIAKGKNRYVRNRREY